MGNQECQSTFDEAELVENPRLLLELFKSLFLLHQDDLPVDERGELYIPVPPRNWPKIRAQFIGNAGVDNACMYAVNLIECDEVPPPTKAMHDKLQQAITGAKLRLITERQFKFAEESLVEKVRKEIYEEESA